MVVDGVLPKVTRRECGGWLAVSPPGTRFKIGVTGGTEREAVEQFQAAWRLWAETLNPPQVGGESAASANFPEHSLIGMRERSR